jgi:hypothetical protein
MDKCQHLVTEEESGDSGLIGPCGRRASATCDDCVQPLCERHRWFIDSLLLCRLCYFIRTREEHG